MTTEQSLVNFEPQRIITNAEMAIQVFAKVVSKKPHRVVINGEQYLEYEDWQTLGEFYRCAAVTKRAVPIEVNGIEGAKAEADLINLDTGIVIGGAEAYCLRDEARWKDKPWFQLASMAQTRAGAKAFRNRLAWVAVMAGYRPTPAEEFEERSSEKPPPKIETQRKIPPKQDTPQDLHPSVISEGDKSAVRDEKLANGIDMAVLRQDLTDCQWSPAEVGLFIKQRYGITGKNQIEKLSREQAEDFMKEVGKRLSELK